MKMHYLKKAIDFKMETSTQIIRMGTPIKDLNAADLPQPSSDLVNMSTLPNQVTGIENEPAVKFKQKFKTGFHENYLEQFHDENTDYAER